MAILALKLNALQLDLKNPRIPVAKTQREALQNILDDQGDKLGELAESIVDDGLNPTERLLVLDEEGGGKNFTVLEGNRRLAALKILANPSVLSGLTLGKKLQKRLEVLAPRFSLKSVEPLDCSEMPDRAAGNKWIELRHTGENEGRGIVSWSGVASSRFRGSDPALQALDFVAAHATLSEADRALLEKGFPITTLDRMLSTPDVRKRIGVEVKDGKLYRAVPHDEVLKPLTKMVLDLAKKKIGVTALKTKAQMVTYVDGFDKGSRADVRKTCDPVPVDDSSADDADDAPEKKKPPRKPDASDRKTVVPKGCRLNVTDNRVAEIYAELRKLKLEDCPNAIAVLLRVFLELSVDHYMTKHSMPLTAVDKGGHERDKSLKAKLREVVSHLVSAGAATEKEFAGVTRALDVAHSPLSVDLLNQYVHNRHVSPSIRDLKSGWDTAQRLFEKVWS